MVTFFNKYYSEFLKNLKNTCKEIRDNDSETADRKKASSGILKAIRTHYGTFDHLSEEYLAKFQDATEQFYAQYYEKGNDFLLKEVHDTQLCTDISADDVHKVMPDLIYVNYIATFGILVHLNKKGASTEDIEEALKYLRSSQKLTAEDETIASVTTSVSDEVRRYVSLMNDESISKPFMEDFKELENTAIGKLAKEIVNDLGGDVPPLDLLSGASSEAFGKLFSTVGGKIHSKLTSGELNQQALMQDALQLASKLPQMLPTGALGGMESLFGGDMQNMIQNFQKMMGGAGPLARNMKASQKLKKKLRDRK